jgi:plastocyanin
MTTTSTAASRLCLAALAGASMLLGACGGGTAPSASGGASSASGGGDGGGYGGGYGSSAKTPAAAPAASAGTPALAAVESGGLSFDHKTLKAKAGSVTLTLTNPGSNGSPHAIAIEGQGVARSGATASPGGTSSVTVNLKPGTYTYYCPVPGHRQAGMEGTLTVG